MASNQPEHPTPGSRFTPQGKLLPRDHHVKARVADIAPGNCRCLIENRGNREKPTVGIQLCHTFARSMSLKIDTMTSIEYYWGMKRGSLNLDSGSNCFYAVSDLHAMFDNGLWGLLPEMKILKKYEAAIDRDRTVDDEDRGVHIRLAFEEDQVKPVDGHPNFYHTYTFLAFNRSMEDRDIHVYTWDSNGRRIRKRERRYPFNKPLLKVQSHLHPKFVILSMGQQLRDGKHITEKHLQQQHVQQFSNELDLVKKLHKHWTKPLTLDQEESEHFPSFDSEDVDTKASRTSHDSKTYRPSGSTTGAAVRKPRLATRRSSRQLEVQLKKARQREERLRNRSPSPQGRIAVVDKEKGEADGNMSESEPEDNVANEDVGQEGDEEDALGDKIEGGDEEVAGSEDEEDNDGGYDEERDGGDAGGNTGEFDDDGNDGDEEDEPRKPRQARKSLPHEGWLQGKRRAPSPQDVDDNFNEADRETTPITPAKELMRPTKKIRR
ncbi:hypothetical protein BJ165DRAFT_1501784 [Panaeolus papilionaceus]|nr:hypothetical protein BJ165DRAFT_1501784 [Panaeolus papilionaceus]